MSISVQNSARVVTLPNQGATSGSRDSTRGPAGVSQGGAAFPPISVEKLLGAHQDLVSILSQAMQSGLGGLVESDIQTETAKLQALQVQQGLGGQSFSIANNAPQLILQLFRA